MKKLLLTFVVIIVTMLVSCEKDNTGKITTVGNYQIKIESQKDSKVNLDIEHKMGRNFVFAMATPSESIDNLGFHSLKFCTSSSFRINNVLIGNAIYFWEYEMDTVLGAGFNKLKSPQRYIVGIN